MPSPKTIQRPDVLVFVADLDSRGGRNGKSGKPKYHVMGKPATAEDRAVVGMCGAYLRGGPTYRDRPKNIDFTGSVPPRDQWCTKRGCIDAYAEEFGGEGFERQLENTPPPPFFETVAKARKRRLG